MTFLSTSIRESINKVIFMLKYTAILDFDFDFKNKNKSKLEENNLPNQIFN
jgi:hypothetical protein